MGPAQRSERHAMNQSLLTLELDLSQGHRPASAADRTGFELGWDHAHHGLVPPAGLLLAGTPVSQGWLAGKAVFGRRTLLSTRPLRVWLRLRTEAWLAGLDFDTAGITPLWLAQIEPTHCPVTRQRLGGSTDAPVTVMLPGPAGCVAGNLLVLGQRAASALEAVRHRVASVLAEARLIEADMRPALPGLSSEETLRLATLLGLATALPHAEAARLPLRVLPPPQLRPRNAAQQLQALFTVQFMLPGWSERLRTLADLLPDAALRHDFNLFVGALAPRLLAAGPTADTRATQQALEDAWGDARVQRRWLQLALQLGAEGSTELLRRAAAAGLVAPATPAARRSSRAVMTGGGAALARVHGAAGTAAAAMGAGTAGRPPKNSAATSGASASWVSGPSGRNQVKVQLIMPNSSIASGV